MKMTMYKAIAALITSVVGLGITFGAFDEAQGQMIGTALTAIANVAAVYIVPNRSK